nr:acetylornithine deacetylase [Nitrosomonas nitrosa]
MNNKRSRELIKSLVEIDTTSRESNLELIEFVEGYLSNYGVPCEKIFNSQKTKANLVARIGPDVAGGVVLSGHTDVVPVDGQNWKTNPFVLTEADGRLYGRGTADMKSFCAVALAMVPVFLEAGLKKPIFLAFSYDEEVGCLGVSGILNYFSSRSNLPAAIIVGEPTSMEVAVAHKGIRCMRTVIKGVEAHSANAHQGESAIFAAGQLICFLSDLAGKYATRGPFDDRFVPPHTTINIGDIRGGSAINIIPNWAEFNWEHRPIPGHDPDEIPKAFREYTSEVERLMQERFTECKIENYEWAFVPAFSAEAGSAAEVLAKSLAGRNDVGVISYTTEAGLFQAIQIPTVICGPGSMDQGHKPNEYVSLNQVELCERFMIKLCHALTT